ncbi:unnamed protein product [Nesidiocoris tenuis]|uniref:Uncharacterized protein n=1 Tax=Nesidiocoris tenuis TaxID=355587 RepID=A0A6H5G4G7_9HEMI|nr:unnamed protein product [Nesidiocoris tenuis]
MFNRRFSLGSRKNHKINSVGRRRRLLRPEYLGEIHHTRSAVLTSLSVNGSEVSPMEDKCLPASDADRIRSPRLLIPGSENWTVEDKICTGAYRSFTFARSLLGDHGGIQRSPSNGQAKVKGGHPHPAALSYAYTQVSVFLRDRNFLLFHIMESIVSQNMIKLCHNFTFQNMEVLCVIYAPLVFDALNQNDDWVDEADEVEDEDWDKCEDEDQNQAVDVNQDEDQDVDKVENHGEVTVRMRMGMTKRLRMRIIVSMSVTIRMRIGKTKRMRLGMRDRMKIRMRIRMWVWLRIK